MSEPTWTAHLTHAVEHAAETAALPGQRAAQPGFDGDALTWIWRAYLGKEAVAADVRLRAWDDATTGQIHATIAALVWPVDPQLRERSRQVGLWSEDFELRGFVASGKTRSTAERWIAAKLSRAWRSSQQAARDLLAEIDDHGSTEPVLMSAASGG